MAVMSPLGRLELPKKLCTKYRVMKPNFFIRSVIRSLDRLCGLVVRVLGYRSGGPGSIPGTTRKKK
jgi:hypothetical protein